MLRALIGDLFESRAQTLVNTVNCVGVMGKGVAEVFKRQFPEMFKLKGGCRFNNCMHKEEPGCAIRAAVESGVVAESRYRSYLDMVAGVDEENPYRMD